MNTSSWIVFKNLFQRLSPEKQQALRPFLSSEDQEQLKELSEHKQISFDTLLSLKKRLANIHYSWFIPFLEPFSERDKVHILSAIEPSQAEKLKTLLSISDQVKPLQFHALNYLQETLFSYLTSDQEEFILEEFLPNHPLNPLLLLSKNQLQMLANYLGLHDLALELKHVVKAEQIKNIQKVLTPPERDYVKQLLKKKEPVSFARLNLDQWDGNEDKLKNILHHRGFNRLGKALFGCHPSLLWHLSHRLDTGRTKILRKFFTEMNNKQAQEKLIHQILELMEFIKQTYE